MRPLRFNAVMTALLGLLLLPTASALDTTAGAGASFPSKVYQRWAERYAQANGVRIRYSPTGSGNGIQQAKARSVAFGGTDAPLSPQELAQHRLVQIPTAVGGVVPVVNLPGIQPDQLLLDGPLLADLFMGRIARWNDARIAALNPGMALPALPVRRIVRSDKSGTTQGFSGYLALVSPAFQRDVGTGQLPPWPGEMLRGDGNDGVVQVLKATDEGIGYVSFDRVRRDALISTRLRNAAGAPVAAGEDGFKAAIRESDLHRQGDDLATLLDRPGLASWPITLTTFVLMDAEPTRATDAEPALRFFYWAFLNGDRLIDGTGFAPLPTAVQARLARRFAAVRPRDGAALRYYAP